MEDNVQTVKGIIKKDLLGIIDSHSHLWIDTENKQEYEQFRLDDFSLLENELKKFKSEPVMNISESRATVIDCQTPGCGRNVKKLLELSESTGVNIISVTGFYKKEFYSIDSRLWKMSKKDAASFFEDEVRNKMTETPDSHNENNQIKAGAIKITFTGTLEGQYGILTEAAIDASLITGAPLVVHTDRGLEVEKLINLFERKEIPFSKIMLCHMDKRADIKLHKALADKSIYLEYDTFNRDKYDPEKNLWPLLIEMIRQGYSSSIMIGTDPVNNSSWNEISKQGGLTGFFRKIAERLSRSGSSTMDIENILKKNTQNFLSF